MPNVNSSSTILTGSSDGLVRAVTVLPTKLIGVVADHGDLPVERIAIGSGGNQLTLEQSSGSSKNSGESGGRPEGDEQGSCQTDMQGRWWVGSVGHDEVLRLTDLGVFFHEREVEGKEGAETSLSVDRHPDVDSDSETEAAIKGEQFGSVEPEGNSDSGEESAAPAVKKRKRKPEKTPLIKKKKGKNSVEVDQKFFSGL